MSRVYDFVASVGPNCRSAWNVGDFFGDFTTRPFDAWITPFHSTMEILKRREVPHFEENDFQQIMIADNADTIYNRRLSLYHHHDFGKGADGLSRADWREAIPMTIAKYRHLFERFWQDFHAARRPLLVLGGLITLHEHEHMKRNGMVAPAWDTGAPTRHDAPRLIRELFPEKDLDVILIFPGGLEIVEDRGDSMVFVGVDDGSRPDYMPPNSWQHPINVFRNGFERFGMSLAHEDEQLSQSAWQNTILDAEFYRLIRAARLFEKAETLLGAPNPDRYKAGKYLTAAYQLNPGAELRGRIEAKALAFDIDLLAGAEAPPVIELVSAGS